MNPVTVLIRVNDRNPGHVRLSVFVGRQPGARGHSGDLTLRTDEYDELAALLTDNDRIDLPESP